MGVQLGRRSNGWTRGWDWRPRDSKVDSPNKWVSYPPRRPLADVIRLLAFLWLLYRFNGSSGIQTRKGTPTRKTDGQTETERQKTRSERNRGKKREKTGRRRIILPARTRGITRGKGNGDRGWKGPKVPREEAWWGVVKFVARVDFFWIYIS